MAAVAKPSSTAAALGDVEQRMIIFGVRWKDYVILREALNTPGLRMTYCEGTLELMSPSRTHELNKTSIARLIELYAFLRDLPLIGHGSTTFRNEAKERGAEPDECYRVGSIMKEGEFPDIVLEVIHTDPPSWTSCTSTRASPSRRSGCSGTARSSCTGSRTTPTSRSSAAGSSPISTSR